MRIPPNHVLWSDMEQKVVSPTCAYCHFARLSKHSRYGATGEDQNIWLCHRNPPHPLTARCDVDDDIGALRDLCFEARWPVVDQKDFCGDWEPDEGFVDVITVDQAQEELKIREAEREGKKCATSTSETG